MTYIVKAHCWSCSVDQTLTRHHGSGTVLRVILSRECTRIPKRACRLVICDVGLVLICNSDLMMRCTHVR